MKQKLLKNYLLLFLSGIIILSCELQEEVIHEHEANENFKIEKVKFNEFSKNANLIKKLGRINSKIEQSKNSKIATSSDSSFTINTDYANYIKTGVDKHSYTFKINRTNSQFLLENLILNSNDSLGYDAFIVQYNISENEYLSMKNGNNIDLSNKTTLIKVNDNDFISNIFSKELYEVQTMCLNTVTVCNSGDHWALNGASGNLNACTIPNTFQTFYSWTECTQTFDLSDIGISSGGSSTNGGGTTTTGSNYDGSDTSIHGNGSNPVNTVPAIDEEGISDDPCTSIKKNTTNKSDYMENFNDLNVPAKYKYPYEAGFALRIGNTGLPNYSYLTPSPAGTSLVIPSGSLNYTHIHNNNIKLIEGDSLDVTVKMLSPADLWTLIKNCQTACTNNGASATDAFGVMVSNEGIFAISMLESFSPNGPDFNEKWFKFVRNYKEKSKEIIHNKLLSPIQRKTKLEKMFLQELKKLGLDNKIGFFEGTVTTEAGVKKLNWTKKTLNSNSVVENPC